MRLLSGDFLRRDAAPCAARGLKLALALALMAATAAASVPGVGRAALVSATVADARAPVLEASALVVATGSAAAPPHDASLHCGALRFHRRAGPELHLDALLSAEDVVPAAAAAAALARPSLALWLAAANASLSRHIECERATMPCSFYALLRGGAAAAARPLPHDCVVVLSDSSDAARRAVRVQHVDAVAAAPRWCEDAAHTTQCVDSSLMRAAAAAAAAEAGETEPSSKLPEPVSFLQTEWTPMSPLMSEEERVHLKRALTRYQDVTESDIMAVDSLISVGQRLRTLNLEKASQRVIFEVLVTPAQNALEAMLPKLTAKAMRKGVAMMLIEIIGSALVQPFFKGITKGVLEPVINSITQDVLNRAARPISDGVSFRLGEEFKFMCNASVVRNEVRSLTVSLTETITDGLIPALLFTMKRQVARQSTRNVNAELIPPTTLALVPTLTHTLRRLRSEDDDCYQCSQSGGNPSGTDALQAPRDADDTGDGSATGSPCERCDVSKARDVVGDYFDYWYARYFARYYAFYYGGYFADGKCGVGEWMQWRSATHARFVRAHAEAFSEQDS
jgi:hypothetical protein